MIEQVQSALSGHPYVEQLVYVSGLLLLALLVYFVCHGVLASSVHRWALRTQTSWDDALVDAKVFGRLAHVPPALVVYYGIQLVPELNDALERLIQNLAFSTLIVVAARAVASLFSAAEAIYATNPENRTRPIKGFVQVVKIVLYLIAGLLVVATMMGQSPLLFQIINL